MENAIGNGFNWVKDRFLARDMSGEDIGPVGNGILGEVYSDAAPLAMADASSGERSDSAGAANLGGAGAPVGRYVLPGIGVAYLDPDFADKVGDFIGKMQAAGIPLQITQAYRSPEQQAVVRNDPTAITPAQHSLHSTGNAIDINIQKIKMDPAMLARTVQLAASSGLQWGGNFRKPDPVHFYSDPGGNRVDNIDRFSRDIEDYKRAIPDY
jgi:hypothetical protein